MKNPIRVLLPIFIVALMVTLSVGIAFAREMNLVEKLGTNRGWTSQGNVAPNKHSSKMIATNSLQKSTASTSTLIKTSVVNQPDLANPVKLPSAQPPAMDEISISHSNTITDEMEITGTVETIMTDTWTVSGQTFAVTPETEIEHNIVVGDKVKVELTMSSTNVLTASQIELLSEDREDVTTEFTGTVETLSTLSITVSGHVLAITPETEIGSNVVVGAKVKVEALVNPDGSLTAKQVELLENDDEQGENQQGNCDENECENHQGGDQNQQGQCHEDYCGGVTSGEHDGEHDSDHEGSHDSHRYEFHDGGDD